jgi:hypothetical protein
MYVGVTEALEGLDIMSHEPAINALGAVLRHANEYWHILGAALATVYGGALVVKRRVLSPYATKAEMMECQTGLKEYINSQHAALESRLSEQHSTLNSHVQHNQEQLWEAINELRHDSHEQHNQVMTLLVQLGRDR